MITSLSIARFVWSPLPWMFVVMLSCLIIAIVCHAFDRIAENGDETYSENRAEENEMVTDEVAVFARHYLKIWTGNRYKYVILPFVLFVCCLIVLLAG